MTRFEDTLRRDLHVIADRATPSSDAWDSIRTRIVDQDPVQETEIIMLTDNTMPARRWPLVAAAAAVIALAIGAIVSFGTGGDDEQIPSEPVPTVQPPPDDTETDAIVDGMTGDADAGDTATDDAADATTRTVTLSGTSEVSTVIDESTPGVGEWSSTGTLTADGVEFESTGSGAFEAANREWSDGDVTFVLTGTVDGIGSGSLTITGQVVRRGDDDRISDATVTEAAGAFDGATGTYSSVVRVGPGTGTWSLTLTLPSDRFADDFAEPPAIAPIATPTETATELTAGADPDRGTARLEAGTYRTDLLGIPMYFDAPELLRAWELEPGRIVLSSDEPGDANRGISISRVGSWFTPEEAVDPTATGLGSIPAGDIDAWLDASGLTADAAYTVTVGAAGTAYREFTVPADHPTVYDEIGGQLGVEPAGCRRPEWTPCFWADSDSAAVVGARTDWVLGTGSIQQMWLVDMDGLEPLLIRAWVDQPDMTGDDVTHWFDEVVPAIVDSIILGPVGPVTAD
jgi:hypothetical protein